MFEFIGFLLNWFHSLPLIIKCSLISLLIFFWIILISFIRGYLMPCGTFFGDDVE
jgi:hypothetical protein